MHSLNRWLVSISLLAVTCGGPGCAFAEPAGPRPSFGSRTLGGRFWWSDEVIRGDWRIQKNAVIGHYRLIDGNDRRQAFGSYEHCLQRLAAIGQKYRIPKMSGHVVVVVHGLGGTRQLMDDLTEHLRKQGFPAVVNFGYASTMAGVEEHAKSLANVVKNLGADVTEVSFVAHSMGNIVIRYYLGNLERMVASERPQLDFKRFVMIAPPNHGAVLAEDFADNKLFQLFGGESGQQLVPGRGWEDIKDRLVVPSFEFGVLAGGQNDGEGYLAALPGDDDMLLTVATTRLAGAADFTIVEGVHQLLPKNDEVLLRTARFLKHGYFHDASRRRPIR